MVKHVAVQERFVLCLLRFSYYSGVFCVCGIFFLFRIVFGEEANYFENEIHTEQIDHRDHASWQVKEARANHETYRRKKNDNEFSNMYRSKTKEKKI